MSKKRIYGNLGIPMVNPFKEERIHPLGNLNLPEARTASTTGH
jgi:hypothetical protein